MALPKFFGAVIGFKNTIPYRKDAIFYFEAIHHKTCFFSSTPTPKVESGHEYKMATLVNKSSEGSVRIVA